MLTVFGIGMTHAVRLLKDQEEFEAMGLRPADVFFSCVLNLPQGLWCVAQALQDRVPELRRQQRVLPCAFSVLSVMLTAGRAAGQSLSDICENDTEKALSTFLCNDAIRLAVKKALEVLRDDLLRAAGRPADCAADEVPFGGADAYAAGLGMRREREGDRLVQLCRGLLGSYEYGLNVTEHDDGSLEYNHKDRITPVFDDPRITWNIDYENTKRLCVEIVILLGYTKAAYELSEEFMYFEGILSVLDVDDSYSAAVTNLLKSSGNFRGAATEPFGTFVLCWFEKCCLKRKGYFSKLLQYAKDVPDQLLTEFLEVRAITSQFRRFLN
jgi:hypothetical protein